MNGKEAILAAMQRLRGLTGSRKMAYSLRALAAAAGTDDKTARTALRELERGGLVERTTLREQGRTGHEWTRSGWRLREQEAT